MSNKLVEAAEKGDLKLVQSLILAGEDVDFVHEHSGFRPLIAAVANGHLEVARFLLSKGAGVDLTVEHPWPINFRGDTALKVAACKGQLECVSFLIQSGASINHGFEEGWSALYTAARNGHAEVVQRLLEAKAKIRRGDLVSAVIGSKKEVVEILLRAGLSACDPKRDSLAADAVPGNREQIADAIEVLRIIVAAGADINAVSKLEGRTALGKASADDWHEIIPVIIKLGGEVNKRDMVGQTALHIAAENGRVNSVKLLLEAGAEVLVKDDKGETPLDLAKYYDYEEVVALLIAELKRTGVSLEAVPVPTLSIGAKEKTKPSSVPTPLGKRVKAGKSKLYGADRFVSFVNDWGNPSWCVVAVEHPLEAVLPPYLSRYPARRVLENVKPRPATDADNEIAPVEAVVQAASSWTIIYQSIGLPVDEDELRRGVADAEYLSKCLDTRALAFSGEDTSGAMGYELYQSGKLVLSHEWESHEESTVSQFKKVGLFVPVCYPVVNNNENWLAVVDSRELDKLRCCFFV